MTIRELMETDCIDVDEILIKRSEKKNKEIKPLADLVMGGGKK